jgi:DNA repair protein RecO (recombination protein O)
LKAIESDALVLRSVPYRESDLIVTLFTREEGKVSVLIRGGRKSQRRAGGALEPFHTLFVSLDDRGREFLTLKEARIVKVRAGLTSSLEALDAAGAALRWLRHLCPAKTPEIAAWNTIIRMLDTLDEGRTPRAVLARGGLRLLTDIGYGLEFERCVRCGRSCAPGRAAEADAARGGLVCQSCGGARTALDGTLRELGVRIAHGDDVELDAAQADTLLTLAETAMAAHAALDTSR